ncbi:MAG: Hint domain-containing protein [Planctomycetes bacterium]|nr:Hint domain-containing protein [Planctomycetota bacterium]
MGLSAYSSITCADGAGKRAEDMASGDLVWDPLAGAPAPVRTVWSGPAVGMYRITADNGQILDLTEDHALVTAAGLVQAGDIRPGQTLVVPGGTVRCTESVRLPGDFKVYDIVTAAGGTLLVSGLIAASS